MKTSKKGLEFIKHFEGCILEAYKCPAGVLTIGIGHTSLVDNKPIVMGLKITLEKALQLLAKDLEKFEKDINIMVKVPLTQNQFDALVSFCFNLGSGVLKRSQMLKLLNCKKYDLASLQFERFIYANGKILTGLQKRRKAEKILFDSV